MISCDNDLCSSFTTRDVAPGITDVGPSLAMLTIRQGDTQRHWVSFNQPGTNSFRVQHCRDPDCSSIQSVSTGSSPTAHLTLAAKRHGTPILFRTTPAAAAVQATSLRRNALAASVNPLGGSSSSGGQIDASWGIHGAAMFYYDTVDRDLVYLRCDRDDCSDL